MEFSVWGMVTGLLVSISAQAAEPPAMSAAEEARIHGIAKEAIREAPAIWPWWARYTISRTKCTRAWEN